MYDEKRTKEHKKKATLAKIDDKKRRPMLVVCRNDVAVNIKSLHIAFVS